MVAAGINDRSLGVWQFQNPNSARFTFDYRVRSDGETEADTVYTMNRVQRQNFDSLHQQERVDFISIVGKLFSVGELLNLSVDDTRPKFTLAQERACVTTYPLAGLCL